MSSKDEANILDHVTVLLKRKGFIAGITVACVVIAAIAGFVLPPTYRAETRILPPQQNSSALSAYLLSQLNSPVLASGALGMKSSPVGLYTGMLRSRVVLDRIIDRFSLVSVYKKKYREDARKCLSSALKVQDDRKSGIIAVRVEDRDAKRSADMANAFVEELKVLAQSLAVSEASQRRLFLEGQIKSTQENLKRSEEAMKGFLERTGTVRIEEQAKVLIEAVARLRAEISAKEVQLRVLKSYSTSRNPDVQKIEEEVKGMREQLARLDTKSSGAADNSLSMGKLAGAGVEYAGKLRELKFNEALYEQLVKHFEAARLDEARDGALIQVIDNAVTPEKRIRPKRLLLIAIAAVAGFFFAIIAAFFLEYRDSLSADAGNSERIAKLKQYAAILPGQ
ncbi:MAG: lipopolysaccharide biosynthesis protein [Nitrospirae bacterium]|nr:MAG: lipopolysaccharide biosynthesis protein [Nitrospirota bacterium]